MNIKAISFDFWNTLFMEQPGGFELYQLRRRALLIEALRSCGDFAESDVECAIRAEAEAHNRIWREEHRTPGAAERLGKILTRLQATVPDPVVAELTRAYEEGIMERPPVLIPGVREALEALHGRYRLGIISDVGFSPARVLKRLLDEEGLLGRFDSLVFSDEAGRSKPHPAVFERTAHSLEAAPAQIAHIGDLEHTDIIGAKRAGYYAIRFTGATPMGEGEQTMADRVTDDFSALPSIIERLALQKG